MKVLKPLLIALLCLWVISHTSAQNNALDFDGNDFVNITDDDLFTFESGGSDQPLTIEAWVNLTSLANTAFVAKWSSTEEYQFGTDASGDLQAIFFDDDASASISNVATTNNLSTATWTHVAVTYDGSGLNTGILLYINGVNVTETTASVGSYVAMENTTSDLHIGTLDGSTNFASGQIDEVRIWGVVRSCSEINSTKDVELIGTESDLIAYYNFNQGTAGGSNGGVTTLDDITSNSNDGGLNGFALTGSTSNWVDASANGVSGTTPVGQPEINVQGNSMDITDGSTTISSTIDTDFGTVVSSNAIDYTIQNTGAAALTINTITITGTNASDFSLGTLPTTVSASGSETFTVTFTPGGSGIRSAIINIDSDDCDEAIYDFAVQGVGPSPGGITTNLNLWLKAGAGVTEVSNVVSAWDDQSGQGNNATQPTPSNQPTLEASNLNGNAVIDFDGTNHVMSLAGDAGITGTNSFSIFAVFNRENDADDDAILGASTNLTDDFDYFISAGDLQSVDDNTNNSFSGLATFATGIPALSGLVRTGSNTFQFYSAGVTDGSTGSIGGSFTGTFNSSSLEIGRSFDDPFNGDLAEIILFGDAKTNATELSQIQSYLAIKYGITIDQTSATNYLASDGDEIWNGTTNMTYNTDITGIGRDDLSGLDQRSSSSINTNAIISIANGDISSPSAFSSDDSWLVWGNNNGATTFGSSNFNNADGTMSNRMTRIWRVQETGTVGNVEISFPNGLATGTVSIVVDPSDNTFANNVNRRVIEMTDNGSDYEVIVDLNDGDLFSFVNASASVISTKPVVINEVIADPQQDWSASGFFDTAPAGSGTQGSDEWIELFISQAGLDISAWTIELLDGSDVTGGIVAGGAFVTSNYLSTTGGSITSTQVGDYVILGNVNGGDLDESSAITINLKNGAGDIIDQVVLDGSSNAPTGDATGTTDESVCRIPNGSDTNVNSTDFFKTRATLGSTNSPTGNVVINEVVTDPQQDWSSGAFSTPSPGGSPGSDDEWIELYIASDGINLTGWSIELTDGSDVTGDLSSTGAFQVSNYIATGGGSFEDTRIGDFLVLGNVTGSGSMNNDILITLRDATGTLIDQVEIGSDPEGDGGGDESPGGNASSTDNESIVRYPNATDTDTDNLDFIQTTTTLGSDNSPTGVVVINEVVTDPIQDWSTNGFNGTNGGETVSSSDTDEWVELYITTAGINLTGWTISLEDGSGDIVDQSLEAGGAFSVSRYTSSASGSFLSTAVGDFLVLGNPTGSGTVQMNNDVLITLKDATGTTVDQVKLGGAGGEAPDGNSTDESDESVSRIPNGTDTDNDAADFQEVPVSMGANNSLTPLAAIGNALDFDNVDDFVSVSDDDGFSFTDGFLDEPFTIEAWVNMNSLANNSIVAKWSSTEEEYRLGTDASGDLQLILSDDSNGATISNIATSATLSTSTWTHIAASYDGTGFNTGIILYIDGVNVTETAGSSGSYSSMANTGAGINIGSLDGTSNFMDGLIDELRIWDVVRNQEQILENLNTTVDPVVESELVAYYRFDRSTGMTLSDVQTGGFDGTLESSMTDDDWVAASWDVFAQNSTILRNTSLGNVTPANSGELTLTNSSYLNDNDDILLFGHDAIDFSEVQTDLPAGTLVTNRYGRTWHLSKNDATGTTNGLVTLAINLGAAPDSDFTYYLLERAGVSGDFSIVPVLGDNVSGTSVIFTLDASQLDDDSYYTIGRSNDGPGNALSFDGSDSEVSLGDAIFDGLNNFTVEAWIRPSSFSGPTPTTDIRSIITKGDSEAGTAAFALYFEGNGSGSSNLVVSAYDGSTQVSSAFEVVANGIVTDTWQQVVATWTAGSGINLYLDGGLLGTTSNLTGPINDNSDDLLIGSSTDTDEDVFDGEIDEVRFWSTSRDQEEIILNQFQNIQFSDADIANLEGYYRFNQGIGNNDTNLPDHSGDNEVGTLANFDNLANTTETSNYVDVTTNATASLNRSAFEDYVLIINPADGSPNTNTNTSDELTITSTITDFLIDDGDFIGWGNDDGTFDETGNDLPTGTLLAQRITKTWNISKNDVVGTADGMVTFSFDLGAVPNPDFTYFLLERTGTTGDFSVVEVIGSSPNGNSIEFTVDGAQITDGNFFTVGRSGTGQGNSLDLDGTNDYISASDNTTLDITSDLTLEAWVNLGSSSAVDAGVIAKYGAAGQRSYALAINSSDQPVFIVSSDGTSTTSVTSPLALATNTWTHVAAVYDANDALTIFIDGIPVATNTTSIPASIFSSTSDLWIGAISNVGVSDNLIDGVLDEVRVWSDIRSVDELRTNLHRTLDVANEGNLIAYYRFNQGVASGTNNAPNIDLLPDQSTNDNGGDLINFGLTGSTTNWIASEAIVSDNTSAQALIGPGNALDFDGTDDHVVISDVAALDITGALTLEAWVNLGSIPVSDSEGIVSKFLSAGNQESYALEVTTAGLASFSITNDGFTDIVLPGTTILNTGEWYHIAAVFTPSTSLQIYLNGVLEGESTALIPAGIHSGTADLWVAASRAISANNLIEGNIDEVRIWNTARTDTDIQDNMFKELVGDETGLVAYYRFDELDDDTSTSLPDITGSNNGSLTNMPTPSVNWISAAAREPFKTTNGGNYEDDTTWKTRAEPNSSTAILDISHDINLTTGTLTADLINVNSGNSITINGGQTITSDNNVINNGTVDGGGILILNGTSPVITGGNFSNLELSGSTATLQGTTTITGNLDLNTNSTLAIDAYNLTVGSITEFNSTANIITLDQSGSGGFIIMNIAQSDGTITFPIFTGTSYTPVDIFNLGTTGDISVRAFTGVFTLGTTGLPVTTVEEVNRSWEITSVDPVNVTVTLWWNSGDELSSFTRTGAFISTNDGTGWTPLSGAIGASGTDPYNISQSGISSFSVFGIASGASSLLPVSLISFIGTSHDREVILDWTTASELNSDRFEIERMNKNQEFDFLGSISGAGTTNEEQHYSFVDKSPQFGLNYYRLKQIDYDGEYSYSPVISVEVDELTSVEMMAYPNPFDGIVNVEFDQELPINTNLRLISSEGNVINQMRLDSSLDQLQMDLTDIPSGIYFLVVDTGFKTMVKRLAKE